MREAVAGRANVEDTKELLSYYADLEKLEAGALWTVANKIEPWFPQSASAGHVRLLRPRRRSCTELQGAARGCDECRLMAHA